MKRIFFVCMVSALFLPSQAGAQHFLKSSAKALRRGASSASSPAGLLKNGHLRSIKQAASLKTPNPLAVPTANPRLTATLSREIRKQIPPKTAATRGRIFKAAWPSEPDITFSGTVFYTYYNGKKEIYGAMATHAMSSNPDGIGGIPRRFEALFSLPSGQTKNIPAEIVAFSPVTMLDIALVKFPKEAEQFLNPYPLADLANTQTVYSLGFNRKGFFPVYNRHIKETLPYSIRTSMPIAGMKKRNGLCGSAVLNAQKKLVGIHIGSSLSVDYQTEEPICSYVTPSHYLKALVQAYHNQGKAAVPFYVDNKRFINLNVDEYVVAYSLLNVFGFPLLTEEIDYHISRSILQNHLKAFPHAKYLLITTHKLTWDERNKALPVFPAYEEEIPKQTYLYNLRTGKQYRVPGFIRPPLED